MADYQREALVANALEDVRAYVRRQAHKLRRDLGLLPKGEVARRRPAPARVDRGAPYTNDRYPVDARFIVQRLLDVQVSRGVITEAKARQQMAELQEAPEPDGEAPWVVGVMPAVLPEGAPQPVPIKPPRTRKALP